MLSKINDYKVQGMCGLWKTEYKSTGAIQQHPLTVKLTTVHDFIMSDLAISDVDEMSI